MFRVDFDYHWQLKMLYTKKLSEEQLIKKEEELVRWIRNFMGFLTNRNVQVKFYPYRSAFVYDEMFDADRESLKSLEYMLAIKAGVETDNHTCYKVWIDGGKTYYVLCHDNIIRIGETLHEQEW